ncbi:MAG: hypothetical protein ACP5NF_02045 [Thermoanaerobaculum sp.]
MPPSTPLDVELAWGRAPEAESPPPAGFVRAFLAMLGDLGFAALCLFLVVGATAWRWDVSLSGPSLASCFATGFLVSGWVEVASLWFFHRTLGLHLTGLRFEKPLSLGKAFRLWLAVLASAPLFALPLVLGAGGARILEKLAGAALRIEGLGARA